MLSRVALPRVLVPASLAAGVLPVGLLVIADVTLGPIGNSALGLLPLLGPPLVALAIAGRLGIRALWITAGGFLVELLILIAFLAALSGANWS